MNKEKFYKIAAAVFLTTVLVLGLIIIFKKTAVEKQKIPVKMVKPYQALAGKIAIVIDDLGYSLTNLNIMKSIDYPVTFSILPGLNFSQAAARELNSSGKQIILHLPMEPKEKKKLESNTILTAMDEISVKAILEADFKSLPDLKGVSNHMGSKATEDKKIMSILFDELKKNHLFFLDSFVTTKSAAKRLAVEKRVKFVRRDVFLDNSLEAEDIIRQISQLKQKARKNGRAVGIGHDRKVTLEILKKEMPKMEKEGFKFVFISELAD